MNTDYPEVRAEGAQRREAITAEIVARTGIDEAIIERLVRSFYARVRTDPLLAPIFESRVHDWEPHLQRMCAFWSSVALMAGRYHGSPMTKHLPLPVDAEHFDRWLALFAETAREVCPPAAASHIVERANRIAESLELGIAGRHGVLLGRGERFRLSPVLCGKKPMTDEPSYRSHVGRGDGDSGGSLLLMLIGGLVLIVIGMVAVAALV